MNETLVLFAQKGGQDGGAAAVGFAVICGYCFVLLASILYAVFIYMTLYKGFSAVSPRNRDMEPGGIFLMLIPFFGIVWYFFVVIRLASSFEKEFEDRGLPADGDFGKMFGILAPLIPCVGLVLQIMWIMKIRGYTAQLAGGSSGGARKRNRDDDDDDDDDRPRKKRRRDEDDD